MLAISCWLAEGRHSTGPASSGSEACRCPQRSACRSFPVVTLLALALLAAVLAVPAAERAAGPKDADSTTASLEPLLAGEFALQSGQLDEAAQLVPAGREGRRRRRPGRTRDPHRAAGQGRQAGRRSHRAVAQAGRRQRLAAARPKPRWRCAAAPTRQARKHLVALLQRPGDERLAAGVRRAAAAAHATRSSRRTSAGASWSTTARSRTSCRPGWRSAAWRRSSSSRSWPSASSPRWCGSSRASRAWPCCVPASCARPASQTRRARCWRRWPSRPADDPELRLAIASEYDALGDQQAAAAALARGPQDDQTYALRASLLAQAEDKPALDRAVRRASRHGASRPDPERRLLLGQMAEFLERYEEALDWYRGVPGGPQRWHGAPARGQRPARTRARQGGLCRAARACSPTRRADDEARRDAYLLEAALRQKDKNGAGELDAYARGLAAFPDDPRHPLCARAGMGATRRHPPRRSRPPQDPGRRSRQRRGVERAGLHPGRPHHPLPTRRWS